MPDGRSTRIGGLHLRGCVRPGQAFQLLRVGNDINACDKPLDNVDRQNGVGTPVEIADDARFAVDFRSPADEPLRHKSLKPTEDGAPDIDRTIYRVGQRWRLSSAVRMENHVLREKSDESIQVAARSGLHELVQQAFVLLLGGFKSRAFVGKVLPGAPEDLAAVSLVEAEYRGNLGVFIVEHFTKQENRPLRRVQLLKKDQESHRQRLVDARDLRRTSVQRPRDQRLRKPLAEVLFALNSRRLQMVNAEPADDRHEKRSWRANLHFRGLPPADIALLHHVLGIRRTPQHSVCDGEKQSPMPVEDLKTLRVFQVLRACHCESSSACSAVYSLPLPEGSAFCSAINIIPL